MNRSLRSAVLAALLCLPHILLVSPATIQAQSADYICSVNPDNTLNIQYYIGAGGAVTVPSSINKTNVTTIGVGAFEDATVTSVIIPAGVKHRLRNSGAEPAFAFSVYSPPAYETGDPH